jgi:hypothetical protein
LVEPTLLSSARESQGCARGPSCGQTEDRRTPRRSTTASCGRSRARERRSSLSASSSEVPSHRRIGRLPSTQASGRQACAPAPALDERQHRRMAVLLIDGSGTASRSSLSTEAALSRAPIASRRTAAGRPTRERAAQRSRRSHPCERDSGADRASAGGASVRALRVNAWGRSDRRRSACAFRGW